jgi:hypothetical protein
MGFAKYGPAIWRDGAGTFCVVEDSLPKSHCFRDFWISAVDASLFRDQLTGKFPPPCNRSEGTVSHESDSISQSPWERLGLDRRVARSLAYLPNRLFYRADHFRHPWLVTVLPLMIPGTLFAKHGYLP